MLAEFSRMLPNSETIYHKWSDIFIGERTGVRKKLRQENGERERKKQAAEKKIKAAQYIPIPPAAAGPLALCRQRRKVS